MTYSNLRQKTTLNIPKVFKTVFHITILLYFWDLCKMNNITELYKGFTSKSLCYNSQHGFSKLEIKSVIYVLWTCYITKHAYIQQIAPATQQLLDYYPPPQQLIGYYPTPQQLIGYYPTPQQLIGYYLISRDCTQSLDIISFFKENIIFWLHF